MFHIVADSGCDIFSLDNVSFSCTPLIIHTSEKQFVDDVNLDTKEMIEYMLSYKGRSYTSCPSPEGWLKDFDLEDGSAPDELYVVTLTSGLSGTYNSASIAIDMYKEAHPNTKAIVFDSLSVGPEMRIMIEKIVELKKENYSFEEVCQYMKNYTDKHRLYFAFKSLHNLAENGRVSKLAASAANVLGISVWGTASEVGQIAPLGKVRGDKKVISSLLSQMEEDGYKGGKVRISQTENPELANKVMETIKEKYPNVDIMCYPVRGLCSYYCERGGIVIGCEVDK